MAAEDKIQTIKQMVTNDKKVIVSNLSGTFQVTEETIRRDLEKLEDGDFLTGTYGGVVLSTMMLAENIYFYKRASSFYEEKRLIARKVLPFIDNKTIMVANSGSTTMESPKLLQDRSSLTLLTNSAKAIHVLAQSKIRVISTGGKLNKGTLSLQGRVIKEIIRRYRVDAMATSYEDLDISGGALNSNEAETEVKKITIRQATEVALLIDHPKFDRKAFVQLADSSHINYIITDRSPGIGWIALCKDNNIQLVW